MRAGNVAGDRVERLDLAAEALGRARIDDRERALAGRLARTLARVGDRSAAAPA